MYRRLSQVTRPYSRRLSSLSQAASRPSASASLPPPPPSAVPSNASPGAATMPQMLVEFYEDDLLNELYAPPIASPELPPIAPSRMQDADLYNSKDDAAYYRQLALEEETVDKAVERFRKITALASTRGDVATHRNANELLVAWYNPFILALRSVQEGVMDNITPSENDFMSALSSPSTPKRPRCVNKCKVDDYKEVSAILAKISPDVLAVIVIHTLLSALMREINGLPLTRAAYLVSEAVRAEISMKSVMAMQRQLEKDRAKLDETNPKSIIGLKSPKTVLEQAKKYPSGLLSAVKYANAKIEDRESNVTGPEHMHLGTKLIDLFMSVAKVKDPNENFVPAIFHAIRARGREKAKVGVLQFSDEAMNVLKEENLSVLETVNPKQQPMVVQPRPWTSHCNGAYLRCQSYLVRRIPGSYRDVENLLQNADLSTVYEGLDALGKQEWVVNQNVLDASQTLWDQGGGIAGLVSKENCIVPERKQFLQNELNAFEKRRADREMWEASDCGEEDMSEIEFDEKQALRKLRDERRKAQKLNRELVSLRADTEHRMRQAQRFAGEERIWLPHNVDFRGRAYPMPVHLQHMGCDLTRALLTFARPGVMLGERGVYWLKIHLANLIGGDKLPFDERIHLAEDNIERAIQVGRDPLADNHLEWWATAEDPFQLLAACCEIAEAGGRFGGEKAMEMYASCLPISMDGSCNGLQHYAALGRDVEGGTQVNLVPNDRPQDVYTGIAKLVSDEVEKLAEEGDEFGLLMRGKVTRKVVKQTVMTSVYGVTAVGARQQIMNRLSEIDGFPEDMLFSSAMRLALLTLSSLGDIFEGATETMKWLYESAQRISQAGHKVQWITPVGLPAMQPYRRTERKVVQTMLQRVTLSRSGEHSPVSTARQRSAFPPNYVHSIDSAHMLMTAIACQDVGLNFAAVHDSFWTNAAHVDVMNRILREEFIKLHERDLLRELRESFLLQFPEVRFPKLPPRGKLNLPVVRDSPYFFS